MLLEPHTLQLDSYHIAISSIYVLKWAHGRRSLHHVKLLMQAKELRLMRLMVVELKVIPGDVTGPFW